jgi:hypothetical protein
LNDVEDLGEVTDGGLIVVGRGSGGADGGSIDAAEKCPDGEDNNNQD